MTEISALVACFPCIWVFFLLLFFLNQNTSTTNDFLQIIEMHWRLASRGLNSVTLAIPHSRRQQLQKLINLFKSRLINRVPRLKNRICKTWVHQDRFLRVWSTSAVREHTPWSTSVVREHTRWSTSVLRKHPLETIRCYVYVEGLLTPLLPHFSRVWSTSGVTTYPVEHKCCYFYVKCL